MTPLLLLAVVLWLTLVALTAQGVLRHVCRRQLRRLAVERGMSYSERDLFNLASRIMAALPVPAGADLRVFDLLYGSQGDHHRYIFTAEYTRGVVGGHQRESRAVTFGEPRDGAPERPLPVDWAPDNLSILDQYRYLLEHHCSPGAGGPGR